MDGVHTHMPDKLIALLGSFPFLLVSNNGNVKLNTARITEGVIIALLAGLIAGAFVNYVMVQRMDVEVSNIRKDVDSLHDDVRRHVEWDMRPGQGMGR